jgi:hypothetical protein
MAQQDMQKLWFRLGATAYYGIVCSYAVHRFVITLLGRTPADELTHLDIAVFGFVALTSWCLTSALNRLSDRIAAVLYGSFYLVRIGTHFVSSESSLVIILGIGCSIILGGMIAMIIGIIPAISRLGGSNNSRSENLSHK